MMARKSKEMGEQPSLTEQNLTEKNLTAQDTFASSGLLDHEQAHPAGVNPQAKCGGALRLAREHQGLSVHEIASRLRLSPKQIEAIEANNFAVLPEPTIVRGFIRNYAKQLKINAQPLLDAYVAIVPSGAPHEMAVKPTSSMKMSTHEKSKSGRYALAALALLLGLGVWLFYQHYIQKPSPTQPSASANNAGETIGGAPVAAVLPEAALPVAERAQEPAATDTPTSTALALPGANLPTTILPTSPIANPATTAIPANPASATATSIQLPNVQPSNSQLPSSQLTASTTLSAAPVAAMEPTPAPMPKGVAKLEFNASQETWVNVVDVNGREVYSKVIFAGSRESIDVKPPVNVTVGNAGGTSMSMDGKPVELAPHSRNNVAHIKLNN